MTEDLFSSEHLITRQKRLDNGATCSVWFAFTTTTISGFDDVYPLTTAGRVVAGILSFIGLALMLGFISNVGTSFVVSKLSKNHKKQVDETKELVKNKMNTLEQLQVNDNIDLVARINKLEDQLIKPGSCICMDCKHVNPTDSYYCNKCGNKIKIG